PQNWPLQAQQKPDGMEVIFLHVGEDQFPEPGIATILGQCYGAHALVCYSGAEIREEFKIEINRHETWCAYAGGATVPLVSESLENHVKTIQGYDWDLRGYFEAIQNNQPDACDRLNSVDPVLEAELNFLYESLNACNGSNLYQYMTEKFAQVESAAKKKIN